MTPKKKSGVGNLFNIFKIIKNKKWKQYILLGLKMVLQSLKIA